MLNTILGLLLFTGGGGITADPVLYEKYINKEDLSLHLHKIAGDEFEGRETGMPGQKKAAEYLANEFKVDGVAPGNNGTYFQKFKVSIQTPENVSLEFGKTKLEFLKDFYYFPGFDDLDLTTSEIVFAGFGIDDPAYSDFSNTDLSGKVVMILSGEPMVNGKSKITGSTDLSSWTNNWRRKHDALKKRGAKCIIICSQGFSNMPSQVLHQISKPTYKISSVNQEASRIPMFYVSPSIYKEVTGKSLGKTIKELSKSSVNQPFTINSSFKLIMDRPIKTLDSENVLGFIEGTDKKDEIVVITAHYDHLGKDGDKIYYGADDDGSGTVAVLELAEAFAKAKAEGNGPRRSILFMPVAGEEKGLLGSQYYTENPVYPLAKTVTDLNIDMIGRLDKKHAGNPNYIYVIGSDKLSKELHSISEACNSKYSRLELDYTYNDENDPNQFYYRSDHYNFAKNNIPVIFYFNGVHEDYHQPTDTVDKIDFQKMEKITRLVFHTAWAVANAENAPKLDK